MLDRSNEDKERRKEDAVGGGQTAKEPDRLAGCHGRETSDYKAKAKKTAQHKCVFRGENLTGGVG